MRKYVSERRKVECCYKCGDQDSRHPTTEIDVDSERERKLLLACASTQPQNVASQPVTGELPLRRGLSESFAIVMEAGIKDSTTKLGAQCLKRNENQLLE